MIEDDVLETISKYNLIESGDRIVLGVSGGPDSVCMLEILNKYRNHLNIEICVAHINHGIRENAKLDEEYVKNFCEKIGIECYVLNANVKEYSKNNKIGLEEAGRKIRYDYFQEIMKKTNSNKIAIAHNKNDNVETIILNVLRGSGPSGLKGILPKNDVYIRPLIEIERTEIESYTKNLNPRHDESNDENEFSRNKVRNIVIPFIKKEFNPNIVETITRLSKLVLEESEYLNEETEKIYKDIVVEENSKLDVYNDEFMSTINNDLVEQNNFNVQKSNGNIGIIKLNLKSFNLQNPVIQKRIILYSINKIFGTTRGIEKIHIDDIIKMCNKGEGNKYLTPNKYTKVLIKNNQIVILRLY